MGHRRREKEFQEDKEGEPTNPFMLQVKIGERERE